MLAAVFILIAIRQAGRFTFRIWQVMLFGALAVLITGQIPPAEALKAINMDVMVFLLGMFIVGEGLVSGGYLGCIAHRLFHNSRTSGELIVILVVSTGLLSALLMNDTIAIIGTPVVLALARRHSIPPKPLLIALAVAVTTGSVASPIGNPQNLLIATEGGMQSPFLTFAWYLLAPTLLNLAITIIVLRLFFPSAFARCPLDHGAPVVCDGRSMRISQCSLAILVVLVALKTSFSFTGAGPAIPLPLIAVCAAVPVLVFTENRREIVKKVDWHTLIFFAAMFVLMESVWQTGFFQSFVDRSSVASVPMILGVSVVISQFISNVPFVALFQPVILQAGGTDLQLSALAAGSTIAGNLTILGAASNVIIIQNAETQGETVTFYEFAKVGIPLTVIQALVYWIWLGLL